MATADEGMRLAVTDRASSSADHYRLAAGIRIAPGPMFSPTGGYRNFIRLNTGFPWRPSTERQIERLGQLVAASAA